jgi:hypothetical protein
LFAAKITDRVTSSRATKFNQLHTAAEVVDEKCGTPFEKQLQFALSQADPYDQSRAEFRTGILRAFRATHFSDYQTLAKELVREQDRKIKYLLARYYSSSCIRYTFQKVKLNTDRRIGQLRFSDSQTQQREKER